MHLYTIKIQVMADELLKKKKDLEVFSEPSPPDHASINAPRVKLLAPRPDWCGLWRALVGSSAGAARLISQARLVRGPPLRPESHNQNWHIY